MRYSAIRPSLVRAVLSRFFAFLKWYFHKGGWRDGAVGLVAGLYASLYSFLKYFKAWYLQGGRRPLTAPAGASRRRALGGVLDAIELGVDAVAADEATPGLDDAPALEHHDAVGARWWRAGMMTIVVRPRISASSAA